jgi:hypothetical protein
MMFLLRSNHGSRNRKNGPLRELYIADKPGNSCVVVRPCTNTFPEAYAIQPTVNHVYMRLSILWIAYPYRNPYGKLRTIWFFPMAFVLWNPYAAASTLSPLWPVWPLDGNPSPPIKDLASRSFVIQPSNQHLDEISSLNLWDILTLV